MLENEYSSTKYRPSDLNMKNYCMHRLGTEESKTYSNKEMQSPQFIDPIKQALEQKKLISEENDETDAFRNKMHPDEIDPREVTK